MMKNRKVFARHTFLPHNFYVQQRMNKEGNIILGSLMDLLGKFSPSISFYCEFERQDDCLEQSGCQIRAQLLRIHII